MKVLAILFLAVFVSIAPAKTLSYDALPPTIKDAIDKQQFDRGNVKAEQTMEDGRVIYKVKVRQSGNNPEVWIANDGQILKDSRSAAAQPAKAQKEIEAALGKGQKLRIGDAPVAVQNAVKAEMGPIDSTPLKNAEVTVAEQQGRKVYQIDYKQPGGRSRQMLVREDGFIVSSDRVLPSSQKDKVTQPGNRFVELKDLPVEAQKSVQRELGSSSVGRIELESAEASNIFKVEIKQAGRSRYIWVEQDGRILKQSEAAGSPSKRTD
jgi:uncharacterized membrane protein YkoI